MSFDKLNDEAIGSQYKRLVELSGAVPLILPAKQGKEKVLEILKQVNGVLLPGGGEMAVNKDGSPSEYYLIIQQILQYQEEQS